MLTTLSLFEQFQALYIAKALPECDKSLIKDGIINEAEFASEPVKLLVIAKEHNTLATDERDAKYDYRVWWNEHIKFTFSHRVSEWAYGLQGGFTTDLDSITDEQKEAALRSIAFINVKKTTGESSSSKTLILDYIKASRELLLQQITEINPTLILCCFRYNEYVNSLFGIRMDMATDGKCGIGEWNGIKVINFFHPSSRKSRHSLYDSLKRAAGEVFV